MSNLKNYQKWNMHKLIYKNTINCEK